MVLAQDQDSWEHKHGGLSAQFNWANCGGRLEANQVASSACTAVALLSQHFHTHCTNVKCSVLYLSNKTSSLGLIKTSSCKLPLQLQVRTKNTGQCTSMPKNVLGPPKLGAVLVLYILRRHGMAMPLVCGSKADKMVEWDANCWGLSEALHGAATYGLAPGSRGGVVKADLALLPVLVIGYDVGLQVDLFELLKQYWLTYAVKCTLSTCDAQFLTRRDLDATGRVHALSHTMVTLF